MEELYNTLIEEAEDSATYAQDFDPKTKFEDCFPFETYARIEKNGRIYKVNIKVELA